MTQPTDRPGINELTSDQLDALYAELDALKSIGRTYCPACGRGDCSPTADQWYEQQQRAEQAEATLTAVRDVLAHWDGSDVAYGHFASQIRAVLDQHGQTPA